MRIRLLLLCLVAAVAYGADAQIVRVSAALEREAALLRRATQLLPPVPAQD